MILKMRYRALFRSLSAICLSLLALDVASAHSPPKNPYPKGSLPDPSKPLEVDLGYEGYVGVNNATSGLNSWYGYVQFSRRNTKLVLHLIRLIRWKECVMHKRPLEICDGKFLCPLERNLTVPF